MKNRSAFTLVELVVVILILGILAGVAAPKLVNTSGKATDNGLRQTLNTIRNALEIYAANNAGDYPGCTGTGADFRTTMQTYIRGEFPTCPVGTAKDFDITPGTSPLTADDATGWMYDPASGEFICNSTDTDADSVAYSTY